ncbi:TetR/AcrR family transcriptional regulator [Paenibacillus sp. Leaf72]|uniref:TetR/AcrR family transcriptional regulator n=1 Tax=Paenibacillus sp. Leaf72 TaxID=1736234 RepID=UPI0006F24D49|nr:TetR/AcrR family transcriptional regulator [Paenibacillus sp. Leaf72]KQO16592.1 TetR family transcriptional regulator [Paenibacillus sp. Leaf72]
MNNKIVTDKHNETRSKLMAKLLPYVRKNGFQLLTMDEISRIMGISRATLYKYYSTKEDIVEFIVDSFVQYIHEIVDETSGEKMGDRFQQIFEQTVLLMQYITDVFLKDLEVHYPEKFDQLGEALKTREQQILDFYNAGIKQGIFNKINVKITIKQDEILRDILDAKYLMENNLTVYNAISDYYTIKKILLFIPDKLHTVDDKAMTPKIEYMAAKITKNLF